jgi:hypothetical protein
MKVIDKTPFQNEKGQFGLVQRVQGIMEYGPSWHAELEAQKTIITQMDRVLEKGFTLIRNLNLENSKIIEPLILIGPPGAFVIYVTPLSGFFEAKGDQWNVIRNDRRPPAPINLLTRTSRLARALQVYLNRQGMYLPGMVEPVLMASSPSVHIESLRPIVRVVMSDAIRQFAASLLQARAVLKPELVYDLVDHIINPRPKGAASQPEPEAPPTAAPAAETGAAPPRARAIFQAAEEAKPFDPADLSFAFDENAEAGVPANLRETSPSQQLEPVAPSGAFRPAQWATLGGMLLFECFILGWFAYLIYSNSR